MNDVAAALLRSNLAASAAVLLVLALRPAARRWFGAETAYVLWAAPPTAAVAILIPGRMAEEGVKAAPGLAFDHEITLMLLAVWLIGLAAAALFLALGQAAFLRALKAGRAGPAVVGVICPRIVMPSSAELYTSEERAVVRAHEREHIERGDPRARAVMAAFQCLFWFNPLAHLAAHLARLDQELACDAAVLRRRPGIRALYARTLMKTQLAATPLPFGCYWPARGRHPLETRVALLRAGGRTRGALGSVEVGVGILAAAVVAWMAQPPIPQPAPIAEPAGETALLVYISRPGGSVRSDDRSGR
jgi:beta-lactamase regulating signal transducer with metallopeptidase domain